MRSARGDSAGAPCGRGLLAGGSGGGGRHLAAVEQLTHGHRGLRALRQPVIETLVVEADLDRRAGRIVNADVLDEATVARVARVGDDDAVVRRLLPACAG